LKRLRCDEAVHQFIHDDAVDPVALGGGGPHALHSMSPQSFGIDIAIDEPTRAGQTDTPEPTLHGSFGDDVRDLKPRQRRSILDVRESLVDRVVGTNEETGADGGKLVCRHEHEVADAVPVATLDARDIVGQRVRMHRDLRMRIRPE
jgi:hypothetical protein